MRILLGKKNGNYGYNLKIVLLLLLLLFNFYPKVSGCSAEPPNVILARLTGLKVLEHVWTLECCCFPWCLLMTDCHCFLDKGCSEDEGKSRAAEVRALLLVTDWWLSVLMHVEMGAIVQDSEFVSKMNYAFFFHFTNTERISCNGKLAEDPFRGNFACVYIFSLTGGHWD